MNKILVILGPTATGKTDLALQLASKFQGELVSCDSRQVYKGLDIGTGKEPGQNLLIKVKKYNNYWEINKIKIWMYDVADPKTQYTVFDYVKDAWKVIEDIWQRGKLPIIVGGTGLYLKALIHGLPNLAIPINPSLRRELEGLSKDELQERLKKMSPEKWDNLNNSEKNNPRRLLRFIELILMYPYRNIIQNSKIKNQKFKTLKIGLTAPREILNKRIDSRVLTRLDQGMVEEAQNLHKDGLTFSRMRKLGLEYGCLADLLEEKLSKEEFTAKLQTKIHQYAKRQIVWFKNPSTGSGCINWFDITDKSLSSKVEKMVLKWYHMVDAT